MRGGPAAGLAGAGGRRAQGAAGGEIPSHRSRRGIRGVGQMGFPLTLALRYMRSRKRAFISVSTVFAIIGVALGTAALVTVMSVTGGFRAEFRDKVLGVNAHVLVLKYSSEFRDYREVMAKVRTLPQVV